MRNLVVAMVLALCGCQSANHELSDEYAPLERVKQTPLRSGGFVTTVGDTVYVNDLDEWLARNPVDSPRYKATLVHEREHSVRQAAYGTTLWIAKYMTDTNFMWEEEKVGWYYEIQSLRSFGLAISPNGLADVLSRYSNMSGQMVTKEDALVWVNDVIAGRWRPGN